MRIELSFLVPPAADIPFLWQLRKGTSFAMCSAGVKYDAFIGDSRLAFILEAGQIQWAIFSAKGFSRHVKR